MKIVYAIPGLGTTKELFRYINLQDAELRFLDWPLLSEDETMQSLAKKMAEGIDETKPFYLIGVSFGGMLSVEISKIKQPVKIGLISSCKCRKELPLPIRLFKYFPIHKWIPESQIRLIARNSRRILGFDISFTKEFHQMIASMKPEYFKRSINCIVNWDQPAVVNANIIHIHGTSDKLLWYKNIKADRAIEKGTHAMIIDKAGEISSIINEYFRS